MDFVNNAFSLQMLKEDCTIRVSHLKKWEFDQAKKDCVSVIGHKETAEILKLDYNRQDIMLKPGDNLYVAQIIGGRLPEGCTRLPKNRSFKYLKVEVM